MADEPKVYAHQYTVPSADIDDLGHAGNYHYVRWMQEAAVAHSSKLGWTLADYDKLGAGWVVRSHQVTYLYPAFEGDRITIRTWVVNLKTATSLRRYEIHNESGKVLAKAETDWAFIDYKRQKPIRIPAVVRSDFEPVLIQSILQEVN